MRTLLILLVIYCFAFFSVSANADNTFPAQPQMLKVSSSLLTEPADFKVTLPASYQSKADKRYVVLVDLHPRSHGYLAGMEDWMSHNGGWPWLETIIVTAPDDHAGLGELKTLAIKQQENQQFLDFMEQDLLLAIDKQYRTNGFRILNGFTGNATFSLYTLLNRPSLFNAYIAASPVLDDNYAFVMADAAKKFAGMKGKPRFLFMSTSDSDFEQNQLADFAKLEAIIKANATDSLDYRIKRFDGTYYMTQPILATAYGIEAIFNDVHQVLKPDSTISRQGVAAILAHYKTLSNDKYGFDVPAIDSLIALASSFETTDPAKAIDIYLQTLKAIPTAFEASHALASVYASQGQRTEAIKYEKQALELTDHPFFQDKYRKQLAEYQADK
ncbi:alpha/beta hydrolase-fold protein [Shewanella sp. SP1S1-7]|uniref:alpha/beta hydrolase-fold protein n=1 Tax=Shewanella sp. SP1S1-7 TaxID=3063536 RepID=UPI002892000E|nr:alpha/beta hydrolase-fold protein [Shewanella sp. SP1S1-7]MDT3335379.1 alpha/beta hydrolase-fold protein [Shewanella sp. SP1S1-7]